MTRELRAEIGNIVTHALGIIISIIALGLGVWSLWQFHAAPLAHAALWVYGLCAILLYTASTVYHSLFAAPLARKVARRFDHAAIYLMIAGSYTPFLWIARCITAAVLPGVLSFGGSPSSGLFSKSFTRDVSKRSPRFYTWRWAGSPSSCGRI